ncbi:MAG TPA: sigma factor, partial [Blastocatellia bacterium]|nr:sigma factor [Blastocatellia bacterium]
VSRRSSSQAQDFECAAMPHLNDLFRTALRVIGNRSEAEDLVQETYLQAWKSFHRFEPVTNCRVWLFKILFHGCATPPTQAVQLKGDV